MPKRLLHLTIATAATLTLLTGTVQGAFAGTNYSTQEGAIPSGPTQGDDEPGAGARVTNKAFGYYIGRVKSGSQFTQVGGRASHYYGRISGPGFAPTGPEVNMCGWIHKSARGAKSGSHSPATCSKRTANKMWQRTNIGRNFSAKAGKKHHNGVPVPVIKPGCQLYYNYFTGTNFRIGTLRDAAGPLPAASNGTVRYRYQTLDRKAVVIFDNTYGWGFTERGCVSLKGIKKYNDRDKKHPPRF